MFAMSISTLNTEDPKIHLRQSNISAVTRYRALPEAETEQLAGAYQFYQAGTEQLHRLRGVGVRQTRLAISQPSDCRGKTQR